MAERLAFFEIANEDSMGHVIRFATELVQNGYLIAAAGPCARIFAARGMPLVSCQQIRDGSVHPNLYVADLYIRRMDLEKICGEFVGDIPRTFQAVGVLRLNYAQTCIARRAIVLAEYGLYETYTQWARRGHPESQAAACYFNGRALAWIGTILQEIGEAAKDYSEPAKFLPEMAV